MSAALAVGAASGVPALASSNSDKSSASMSSTLQQMASEEPVLMLVSLRHQSMRVFSGDTLVARSRVSTGMPGHRTPTGVFSVLEKRRRHHSNIYSRAPMPFMQRLTWSGIALHESNSVPDYPASHGCVRLPGAFAKQLFGYTDIGAHVIVTEEELTFGPVTSSKLFYPNGSAPIQEASSGAAPEVAASPSVMRISSSPAADDLQDTASDEAIGGNFVLRRGLDTVEDDNAEDAAIVREPAEPLRILITRRTGRELVGDIQRLLNELGHDAGDVDGLVGPDTGNAIVRFQKEAGLTPTGTVSVELARLLHEKAGRDFASGHLYVRQAFRQLFDAPVTLTAPDRPLGTHFLAALAEPSDPEQVRWVGASLSDRARTSPLSEVQEAGSVGYLTRPGIREALERIELPAEIRDRLMREIVAGSSLIISDHGISNETHKGTDFVVLTDPYGI